MLGKECKAYWERMKGMLLENQRHIMKGLWGKNKRTAGKAAKGILGENRKAFREQVKSLLGKG